MGFLKDPISLLLTIALLLLVVVYPYHNGNKNIE